MEEEVMGHGESGETDVIANIERHHTAQGISQRALAEKAGLSVTQMNRIMTRQRKLTAAELTMLGEALGVTASDLLGEVDRRLSMAARVGRAERAPELEGPFIRAEQLLRTRDLLDGIIARPEVEAPPVLRVPTTGRHKDRGEGLALQLRKALGKAIEPVDDLEGLAARFGLDVSTQPLPGNLHGLLVTDHGQATGAGDATAVALLNAHDTHGRRRFTLAHELGHFLFGDGALAIADYENPAAATDERWTPEKWAEFRADCFAKHLLAPDALVQRIADELEELGDNKVRWGARLMVEVALVCGISFQSAGFRANDVGLLSNEERAKAESVGAYRAFADAGRTGEQGRVLDTADGVEPPSALLGQALTAYQTEMLGLRPLATLYDLSTPIQLEGLRTQLREAGWAPEPAGAHF